MEIVGHAGSRYGWAFPWAVIVYEKELIYLDTNTMCVLWGSAEIFALLEVNAWMKWERAEDKNCYAAFEAADTDYACVVGGRRRYAKTNMIAG